MFQFKQFSVQQDQCAMKIGTDGVLLGAWAPIENNPIRILDIGTGTGILSLMLAQRSDAEQLDALEIDEKSYEQAVDNFEDSPWNDRLFCYHASLTEFIEEPEHQYDLIVCNPPFYSEDYKPENEQRNLARFQDAMPFEDLIEAVAVLLSDEGVLAVVIPFKEEIRFISLAQKHQLFPLKITRVRGTPTSDIKRSLLAFSRKETANCPMDELVIETQRHVYTSDYTILAQDFYLKM